MSLINKDKDTKVTKQGSELELKLDDISPIAYHCIKDDGVIQIHIFGHNYCPINKDIKCPYQSADNALMLSGTESRLYKTCSYKKKS